MPNSASRGEPKISMTAHNAPSSALKGVKMFSARIEATLRLLRAELALVRPSAVSCLTSADDSDGSEAANAGTCSSLVVCWATGRASQSW